MRRSLPLVLFILLVCPLRTEPVLVLPFFNESPAANVGWISESIAHTIREALVSRGMLAFDRDERETVYRRLSIRPTANLTRASVLKVAEELDASWVVYGRFELTPGGGPRGTLRVTAETLDMKRLRKGVQLIESGPLEQLAAIQSRLAWHVLRHFAPETTPSQQDFLRELPPVRLDAMENYTRGLLTANPEQKQRFFLQAARLDAGFFDPRYELGRLYWEKKEFAQAATWLEGVKPPAPRYLEATFLLGLCRYSTRDYGAAQAAFERVAGSVPLNEVFNNLGAAQSRRNLAEAVESFDRALEGDDADPDYHFNRGYALWKLGRFDEAAASFRAVLDRDPEDAEATLMLGRSLKHSAPAPGEAGLERIKLNYQEGAYRQLKAALESLKRR